MAGGSGTLFDDNPVASRKDFLRKSILIGHARLNPTGKFTLKSENLREGSGRQECGAFC